MIRKYLSISKSVHTVLEIYAKHSEMKLGKASEYALNLGLRYSKDAHQRPENLKVFDKRLPEFHYTVGRSTRTYLAVSPQIYHKVISYCNKKRLSIVEGTWRLLSIGIQYSFRGESREEPKEILELREMIREHLKRKFGLGAGKLDTKDVSNLEDKAIRIIQGKGHKISGRNFQKNRTDNLTIRYLKMIEPQYITMLQGAQKEIERLKKRNESLESEMIRIAKSSKQHEIDSANEN